MYQTFLCQTSVKLWCSIVSTVQEYNEWNVKNRLLGYHFRGYTPFRPYKATRQGLDQDAMSWLQCRHSCPCGMAEYHFQPPKMDIWDNLVSLGPTGPLVREMPESAHPPDPLPD